MVAERGRSDEDGGGLCHEQIPSYGCSGALSSRSRRHDEADPGVVPEPAPARPEPPSSKSRTSRNSFRSGGSWILSSTTRSSLTVRGPRTPSAIYVRTTADGADAWRASEWFPAGPASNAYSGRARRRLNANGADADADSTGERRQPTSSASTFPCAPLHIIRTRARARHCRSRTRPEPRTRARSAQRALIPRTRTPADSVLRLLVPSSLRTGRLVSSPHPNGATTTAAASEHAAAGRATVEQQPVCFSAAGPEPL